MRITIRNSFVNIIYKKWVSVYRNASWRDITVLSDFHSWLYRVNPLVLLVHCPISRFLASWIKKRRHALHHHGLLQLMLYERCCLRRSSHLDITCNIMTVCMINSENTSSRDWPCWDVHQVSFSGTALSLCLGALFLALSPVRSQAYPTATSLGCTLDESQERMVHCSSWSSVTAWFAMHRKM